MKYTVIRDRFFTALQKASYFTSSKIGDIGQLRGVLIEATQKGIFLKTTNIHEYFTGEMGGKVEEEGVVLVDFKTLLEVVRAMPDSKINVEKKGTTLILIGEMGEAKIPLMNHEDFPQEPTLGKGSELDPVLFSEKAVGAVLFSAASEETRPILTGVCFELQSEKTNLVATDGFRMSLISLPSNKKKEVGEEAKLIIPNHSLMAATKIFPDGKMSVLYYSEGGSVEFVGEGARLVARVLEGEYPPYQKVIPSNTETLTVFKRADFASALKTVSLFAKDGSSMVSLSVSTDGITISSSSTAYGEATFKVPVSKHEGKEIKITFNYRFLSELINATKGDEISLELTNSYAPGLFRLLNDERFIHIIMPIRSQE